MRKLSSFSPLFLFLLVILLTPFLMEPVFATNYEKLGDGDFESGDCVFAESKGGDGSRPWYVASTMSYYGCGIVNTPGGFGFEAGHVARMYVAASSYSPILYQDVGFLVTDNISKIELFGAPYGWSYSCSVKVWVYYSDGSYDTWLSSDYVGYGLMVHISLTGSNLNWIDDGKLLVTIGFQFIQDHVGGLWYFDNATLSSSVDSMRFAWVLTPAPNSITNSSFVSDLGVGYVFHGYFYNGTETNEDGTFSVSSTYTSTSGVIVDGAFSFNIAARSGSSNFSEVFTINAVLGSFSYNIVIDGYWIYSEGEEGGVDYIYLPYTEVPNYLSFIVLFCVVGLPSMVMGMAGAKVGWGLQGLLFGGILGLGVGVCCSLIPFWFVFLLSIFVVVFLYSMARKS